MQGKVITPIVTRENGRVEIEFKAEFDGNLIGFFSTYSQAESELDQHVLDLCERGLVDQPIALQAEQALIGACAIRLDPPGPGGPEPDDLPTGNDPAPGYTFTADDLEADEKARSWSRRLLRRIVEAADASAESYAAL